MLPTSNICKKVRRHPKKTALTADYRVRDNPTRKKVSGNNTICRVRIGDKRLPSRPCLPQGWQPGNGMLRRQFFIDSKQQQNP